VIAEYAATTVDESYVPLVVVPPLVLVAEPLPIELVGEVSGELDDVEVLGAEKLLLELGLLKPP
jgi:hypothetical protein